VCQIEEGFVFSTRDKKRKKSSEKKRETQTIPAFTIPLHTLLCQALKSVSTTNQKPKSIK
jgi:hypothetical protein